MSDLGFHGDFKDIMGLLKDRLGINNAILRKLDGDELKTIAYFGYGENEAMMKIMVGQGVTGLCAKEKKNIVINDLEHYAGMYLSGIDGAKSELCIPLLLSGRLIGTLNIESIEKSNFSKEKIDLAVRIAQMLVHSVADLGNKTGRHLARTLALLEK
ncbi:MAG: GAF domain-containing protein [Spirochaetes bacterium]|nr:GAF domain-containing protein [Spirochaetota bacterium]